MSDLSTYFPYESHEPADDADVRELDVLAHVHSVEQSTERPSQRSVAAALGMSLGLTNAILRRLVDKGFLMMRRINHNNVHYLVTPDGIDQISRRSFFYIRRTVGHVVRYKERLLAWCHAQKKAGVRRVVLVGHSDLEFLLEWCASKAGLEFSTGSAASPVDTGIKRVTVLAESPAVSISEATDSVQLNDLLIDQQARL